MDINLRPIVNKHQKLMMTGGKLDRLRVEQDLYKLGLKHGMHGAGIFSWIKRGYQGIRNFLSGPRMRFSPAIRAILEKHGNEQILSISVHRKPVFNIIEKLANILSLNRYEQNKSKLSYDKMFHLYLIVKINGGSYKVEKNEQINIVKSNAQDEQAEGLPVGSKAGLTFNAFLENPFQILTPEQYFGYHAYSTNCQHFVSSLLQASGLLTAELSNFITQDVEAILEGTGYFKKIADFTTDLAARGRHMLEGGKMKDRPKKRAPKPKKKTALTKGKKTKTSKVIIF